MATMTKCDKCGFYYLEESCSCGVIRTQVLREVLEVIDRRTPEGSRLATKIEAMIAEET